MLYPVAIEVGNEEDAFGVVVPDLKGCFSAGDSYEEALANAVEAIEGHLELMAEDGHLPPQPGTMEDLVVNPEYEGWVWALVDVDVEPYLGKSAKINVTLPALVTRKIDDTVSAHPEYASRSHFLQVAALNELRGHSA